MRVAIVHDYLTQRGGAERVVLALTRAFPDAPVFTSLYYASGTFPEFANVDVRPMPIDRLSPLREPGWGTVVSQATVCLSCINELIVVRP